MPEVGVLNPKGLGSESLGKGYTKSTGLFTVLAQNKTPYGKKYKDNQALISL